MSLFGNPQPAAGSTPSLFGNTAAQQQPASQTPNLFGAAPAQPAPTSLFGAANPLAQPQQPASQTPSLFGSAATPSQTTTTPSLFSPLSSASQTSAPKPSLFGAPAATTQPAAAPKSLFGAPAAATPTQPAATTTPAAGGLFGSSLASAAAKPATGLGGGLFGAANTPAQQPAATGGLFGAAAATTQPAATGGLFGAAAATTQPAATGGLFGAAAATTQPAATGGLFGSTATAQPAPSLGLFGNTAAQNTTQPAAAGLGASIANPAAANLGAGSLFGANQQLGASSFFESLLTRSKKQAEGESMQDDLPSLQLGLGDLRQRLRKLGPQADPLHHGKAQYMLAASGVDPGAAAKALKYLAPPTVSRVERPSAIPAATDIDIDAYLSNLQSKTTLNMISDSLERSAKDFDNFLEDSMTMEWEAQRKRVYEHFGVKVREDVAGDALHGRETVGAFGRTKRNPRASRSVAPNAKGSLFGRSTLQKSVIGTPAKIGSHQPEFKDVEANAGSSPATAATPNGASTDDRFVREKRGKLAQCIRELNLARIDQAPYPILHALAEIESKSGDRYAEPLVDAYHAAMAIVGENPDAETFAGEATARERQFKDNYFDPSEKSVASSRMRKRILDGANRFLEQKFFREVESVIAKYPREAALGGRPDVISKIQAYVRLRSSRRDLVPDGIELQQDSNGEFIWAVVFYLLRSGHVDEAAHYVKAQSTVFRTIDRTFASYLLEYVASPERRLRRQMQDRCHNEYNQRARNAPENSIDPYRMACYKVVGRCDVNNRSFENLNTEIDDWIWLQFNLARENDKATEVAAESYGLQDLRASIREIGLKHFPKNPTEDANNTFGMFFYLQILSGMFEQAIAYLFTFSYMDAIHFAIALEYYGLIRTADPWTTTDTLLSYDTRQKPQLSFGRMLGYYTRDFRAADVDSAVDYLTLICLNADLEGEAGRQQKELCHVALRELVLETREFSKLIGDIRPDGRRIPGLIENRGKLIGLLAEDDFVKSVALQAARFADDNGRTTDSVLLYHLAGDYDSVITIVSRALSEAISLEIGEDPMRLMPVKPRAGQESPEAEPGSSLSLASIDDPIQLASTMMQMYEKDAMFVSKIKTLNRSACNILLRMSEIKGLVEAGQWPEALDKIRALDILPFESNGDAAKIRNYAAKFASLSQTVAINVPNLLTWTITCCVRQRERLTSGQFSGNEGSRRMMLDGLKQIGIDLTTYTSQLRYRFPPHLLEVLAKASAD